MSKDPFIEFIENFLESECGVGFDQDTLRAVHSLNDEQISFFHSQLNSVDHVRHEEMVATDLRTDKTDSEVQPSMPNRPYSAMFTHPYNGLKAPSLDELKRQLLFFNKVAVIVPQARFVTQDLHDKQQDLEKLLRSYLFLLPLVEQGSVELIPMSGFYSNEIEGGAGIIREVCLEDDAVAQWIDANRSYADDFAASARKEDPYFDAGIRIASSIVYGQRLAATHPFVGGLFSKLFGHENQTPNLSMIETVRNLNKVHLPGLSGFDWQDVVAIRKNETDLEEWRVNFHAAVSSVDPYLSAAQFVERFNAQVPAQLAQAARELRGKLDNNSSLSRFRKGSSEVVVSAIAAVITGNPFGPIDKLWESVRIVAEAEGAKQALQFLWGARERSSAEALKSHYAVFNTSLQDLS